MIYKKTFFVIIIVVILIGCSSSANSIEIEENKTLEENPVEYYAILIGIEEFCEEFDGPEYEEEGIDDAAVVFYDRLIKNNWSKENIKLILNENGTKEDIKNAITVWLDEREDENDVVIYYFSGHSWKIPFYQRKQGHTYTFPYDSKHVKFSEEKITDIELESWLEELETKHLALIMDTCYSGRMKALAQNGRVFLAAGGRGILCPVAGDKTLGSGIFTFFLLQGFDGVADLNNDGWVTVEEAFRYARWPTFYFSVWRWFPYTNHLPHFIGIQIPYIYDRYPGQLPLFKLN